MGERVAAGAVETPWALRLFRKSVLKQAKWRVLRDLLGDPRGLDALDLGADNGVVSWLLREAGGRWRSADLDEETVAAIRSLVGDEVHVVDGRSVPFPDASLDAVVVVDLLEHVATDRELVADLVRTLRPGGALILNVPHRKRLPLLRPLRQALGLTDAWHGHVRPGYSLGELRALLPPGTRLVRHRTYVRFFSELLDIALNYAVLRRTGKASSAKGMVVTGGDVARNERLFRVYSWIYPLAWLWARLDLLLPWTSGYVLAVRAEKQAAHDVRLTDYHGG